YEVLAYHFAKAEAWDRTLDYAMKAADKAAKAFANREALALYDQAEQAAGRLGDAVDFATLVALHRARAGLFFAVSNFKDMHREAERLRALARRVGDSATEAAALATMGSASGWGHQFDRALLECGEALAVARRAQAKPAEASAVFTIGFVRAVTGRVQEARADLHQALAISESVDDAFHRAASLAFLGQLDNWAGNYPEAARKSEHAVRIARGRRLFIPIVWNVWQHALILVGRGDYDSGLAHLDESRTLSEKAGEEVFLHRTLNTLGWLWIELGDLERAVEFNQRGAEGGRKRSDHETQANSEINLGDAFLVRGDLPLARETLEGVHRLVKDPATSEWMRWRYSTHLFASLGDLWLARGDPERARAFADQCLELAERSGARKNLVKGWRLAGEIATARRQWDEAAQALRRALDIAEAIGNPTQLWKTHMAWGRLLDETGKRVEAHTSYV